MNYRHKYRKQRRKRRKRRIRGMTPQRQRKRDKKIAKRKWRPKTLADIVYHNQDDLLRQHTVLLSATHQFIVAEFAFGYVVECESIDERDLCERETLFSRDGEVWTLLGRVRKGPCHHDMKWYPRDTTYPIGCKVRL